MKPLDKRWNKYFEYCLDKGLSYDQIRDHITLTYSVEVANQAIKEHKQRKLVRASSLITIIVSVIILILLIKPVLTGYPILDANNYSTATITINFSQEIGIVNDYFYGVNTHGTWGSNESMIDTNGDGISDTASDYDWHRDKLKEANIRYIRADMNLNNYIFGIPNKGAENWQYDNTTLISGIKSVTGYPLGWDFEIVGAGSIGTISKSIDAHSGQYSVNITNTGTSAAFSNLDLMLPKNHIYNLSVWIKSSYNVSISLQREDVWSNACKTTSSGNNTWELLTCIANITTDVSEGWRIVIQTNPGQNLLWDDISFKQDNSDFYNIPDLSKEKSIVKWANENDIKVLFIASYMPMYLANITSDCYSDTKTCPPINVTEWGNNVVKYITEVTENGLYSDSVEVEVWNEPDLSQFWLSNVSGNDPKRAKLYGQLYNATYNAIKSQYPNMKVGGPAVTGQDTNSELILRNIIQNYTFDFLSYHKYLGQGGSPYYDIALKDDLTWIYGLCNVYGTNCPRILLDEWNVWDSSIKLNNESYWKMQLALAYTALLDNYPENITTAEYQWSESTSYNNAAVYPEYPQRWSMVSEPQLDNQVYASYNITKDFATYYGPGSRIISTNSLDSNIVVVASQINNKTYFTVINKNATKVNVTVSLEGSDFNQITELETGLNYSINDSFNIIDIGAYSVNHYELLNITLNETSNVLPIISSIVLSNGSNILNCSVNALDDNLMNITIEYYNNSILYATNNYINQSSAIIADSINVTLNTNTEWYCEARVFDGLNYSDWTISNNITINITPPVDETPPAPVSSSGGGGGSSYVPIPNISINESIIQNISENISQNVSENVSNTSSIDIPIIEENISKAPIEEQPLKQPILSKVYLYIIIFTIAVLIIIIYFKPKPIITNPRLDP